MPSDVTIGSPDAASNVDAKALPRAATPAPVTTTLSARGVSWPLSFSASVTHRQSRSHQTEPCPVRNRRRHVVRDVDRNGPGLRVPQASVTVQANTSQVGGLSTNRCVSV